MSMSSGAGSPVFFQCWGCRRRKGAGRPGDKRWEDMGGRGTKLHVTLTGRTKPHHAKKFSAMGARSGRLAREYFCQDCGHQGWSAHVDLDAMAARSGALELPSPTADKACTKTEGVRDDG